MLYLSEKALEIEELVMEKCFIERDGAYYFVSERKKEDTYLCVKLLSTSIEKRYEPQVIRLFVDGLKKGEPIVAEEEVTNKEEIENVIHNFFYHLSYDENPQNIMFFEGIYEFIKEYIDDGYFYTEENKLIGEFMEVFSIEGTAYEGYYEGNIVLRDVVLKNRHTGQEIKSFDAINLCSNLYIEEEDDAEWMIEALLESMSEHDIKEKLMEIENQEEK